MLPATIEKQIAPNNAMYAIGAGMNKKQINYNAAIPAKNTDNVAS